MMQLIPYNFFAVPVPDESFGHFCVRDAKIARVTYRIRKKS